MFKIRVSDDGKGLNLRAESKLEAEKSFKRFIETFDAKYPGAVKQLLKTKESTMTFYDFPAEHWSHICSLTVPSLRG